MTEDEIIKKLRDMAKYPTVTLPRDCEALKAAADLLAQPEQEQQIETLKRCLFQMQEAAKDLVEQTKSLAPPQRKPMTDEEIHKASTQAGMQEHYMGFHSGFIRFARAIEAAHNIKGDA